MSLKDFDKKTAGGGDDKWHKPEAEPKHAKVRWTDPNGKKFKWAGLLRILEPDDELAIDRRLALWIGGNAVESFPDYAFWRALAVVRVLWPDLPPWLDWLVTRKETGLASGLAMEVDKFEAAFRLAVVGPSSEDPNKAGLSVSSGDDPEEDDSVGGG